MLSLSLSLFESTLITQHLKEWSAPPSGKYKALRLRSERSDYSNIFCESPKFVNKQFHKSKAREFNFKSILRSLFRSSITVKRKSISQTEDREREEGSFAFCFSLRYPSLSVNLLPSPPPSVRPSACPPGDTSLPSSCSGPYRRHLSLRLRDIVNRSRNVGRGDNWPILKSRRLTAAAAARASGRKSQQNYMGKFGGEAADASDATDAMLYFTLQQSRRKTDIPSSRTEEEIGRVGM